MIRAIASALDSPSSGPELTSTPSPGVATPVTAGSGCVGGDDHPHRQAERPGEVQVALVVRGHRHDRAGAVVGQHVVGGLDRDSLAVDRVDRVHAQEDAGLLPVGRLPLDVGQLPHLRQVRLELGPLLVGAQLGGQRRVRGDDEERRAVQRVGPGREDGDRLVAPFDRELDLGARSTGRSSCAAWSAPGRASCPRAPAASASSRSAYSVILKYHWVSTRRTTSVPQRSQRPPTTCSLASTVWSLGHQLT